MNLIVPFGRSAVSPLADDFSGLILLPGDDGFEDARRVHNGMIDRRPKVIARCIGDADVADALAFAIEHDLEVAVRGGGLWGPHRPTAVCVEVRSSRTTEPSFGRCRRIQPMSCGPVPAPVINQ